MENRMQARKRSGSPATSQGYSPTDDGLYVLQEATVPPSSSKDGVLSRDNLSSHHALDSASQIDRWQIDVVPETEDEEAGIGARLSRACFESLTFFLQLVDGALISKREKKALRRCRATLKLWADGHGVWNGKLDHILGRSKGLQHLTLSVLNPLCSVLLHGLNKHVVPYRDDDALIKFCRSTSEVYGQTKWLLLGLDECTSDSDSDNDTSGDSLEQSGIKRIVEDVKTYTDCLVDLSTALECPAVDAVHNDHEHGALKVEQRAAHDYHTDLILAKYPKADAVLVECLGKTSWSRYQRMQLERERYASVPQAYLHPQSAVKSHITDSEFEDSGLGPCLPSAPPPSEPDTEISFMTSIGGGKRARIPSLSAEAKRGEKFECHACGRNIRATTNRDWRKHLFLDLQPYTCFYADCAFSATPFADRQLWSKHVELDHNLGPSWEAVQCTLCREVTEPGKSAILIHFARHMEDIALAALPRDVESDSESGVESAADTTNSNLPSEDPKYHREHNSTSHLASYLCGLCKSIHEGKKALIKHLKGQHMVPNEDVEGAVSDFKIYSPVILELITELQRLFSDEHLSKDVHLREQMDSQGFVPVGYILDHHPRILSVGDQLDACFEYACPKTGIIEYRSDMQEPSVRRREGWEKWVLDPALQEVHAKDDKDQGTDTGTVEDSVPSHDRAMPKAAHNKALTFITGSTPEELKSKKNQTIIRKKAMDHYLKGEK